MKMALTSPAVAACQGKLYVCGGAILEDGDGIDLTQVQLCASYLLDFAIVLQLPFTFI